MDLGNTWRKLTIGLGPLSRVTSRWIIIEICCSVLRNAVPLYITFA